MSEQSPGATAATYFQALEKGDVPGAMAMLAPDVAWHQPGANRFSGDHVGVEEVGRLIGGMMETSRGTFRLEVDGAAMINGRLVAVPVRFSGDRGDVIMDLHGVDLLTIRDGRIAEVHLFSEDGAAEDAFWGQAG